MKRFIFGLFLAWYVVTYAGQRFAGPFPSVTQCREAARAAAGNG